MHSIFIQELSLAARNEVDVGVGALHTVCLAASVSAARTLGFLIADGDADLCSLDPCVKCEYGEGILMHSIGDLRKGTF